METAQWLIVTLGAVPWLIAEWNRWAEPFLEAFWTGRGKKSFEILIPIRDEGREVPRLIEELMPFQERVRFLDDGSEDEGPGLLRRAGFKVLSGKALPSGWTGKNWACYQLGEQAASDILIFMDADVRLTAKAVQASLDLFEDASLGAFSVFPRQITSSWWEKRLVPWVMQWSLWGWLPLGLVPFVRSPRLVAACGQWFVWRREVYLQVGGHQAVHKEILEDMMLARRIKQLGFKFRTLLSMGFLQTHMYCGWKEIQSGFGKNIFLLVGGSWISMLAVVSVLLIYVFGWMVLWHQGSWSLALFFLFAQWRMWRVGLLPDQRGAFFMHLFSGALTSAFIVYASFFKHMKGAVWKRRSLAGL